MFINFTNHPSANWDPKQKKEAQTYGEIQDVPFPIVPPAASQAEVHQIARDCAEKILSYHPDAVLCQGEFTLAFQVITLLKKCVKDFNQTLVMITHDETIAQMADVVVVIEDGKVVRNS